jgi:hypothetical protein
MDYNVNASNRCVWFRITSNVKFCEHGNETSGVIQRREFLDQLSDCQLLKEDFSSTNYVTPLEAQTFQNFRSHLKIQSASGMTGSEFHTGDRQILDYTARNLVGRMT